MAASVGSVFRSRGTCSVWTQYRTNERLPPARTSHRPKPAKGCKGEVLAGGCGGVPHNNLAPFSWPAEGRQVEDYARRGDEVEHLVDLTSIGWKSPCTAG